MMKLLINDIKVFKGNLTCVIILFTSGLSFAQHESKQKDSTVPADSASVVSTPKADSKNTELTSASAEWISSSSSIDSVDVVIIMKINNPDPGEIMEVRYGSTEGSGDLVSMDLCVVKEGDNYFLVNDYLKLPVLNGSATITAKAEKFYLLEHDRHLNVKLKDEDGKEQKQLVKKEKK